MNYLKLKHQGNNFKSDQLGLILESAGLGVWELDASSGSISCSDHCAHILGYSSEEFSEIAPTLDNELVHPNDIENISKALSLSQSTGAPLDVQYRLRHKSGKWLWMYDRGKVIDPEQPHLLAGIRQNITEHRERDLELVRTQDLLEKSNKAARIGTWEVDLKHSVAFWSPVTKQIHEVVQDFEPNLDTALEFFKDDGNKEKISKAVDKSIHEGTPFNLELILISAKGNEKWVRSIGIPEFKDGICTRLYGTFQDIDQMKTAELELQKSHETNRIFVEQAPNAMAMFDENMRYVAASSQWIKDYKLEGVELIGRSHYDIFPEIDDDWKKIHQNCLNGEVSQADEAVFERLDGSKQWVTWDVRPWYKSSKKVGGLLMSTADITQRKIMEIKLRQNEQQFRNTFEHSANGMALVSTEGQWIRVNQAVCDITGYTRDELITKTFQDITHPDDLDKDLSLLTELANGKRESYQMEKRYFHKSGKLIWVNLSVAIVRDDNDQPVHYVSQITDITATKIAQKKLHAALDQLQAIFNSSTQVSIISTDVNGKILAFNKGAENLLGYSADEMVGKQSPAIIHNPREIEQRGKQLSEELGREVSGFDVFVEKAKTEMFDSREWTYLRKDGSTFPVQLVVTAMRDTAGVISGFLGVATDISKIKKVEEEMARVLAVTNDQNTRLMNFTHIVSHNLRSHSSNLTMILRLKKAETNPEILANLDSMLTEATENLEATIRHLNEVVAINRNIEEGFAEVNLHQYLEASLASVSGLFQSMNATVEVDVDSFLEVKAVPAYLESILLNLLTNAIKYSSRERKPMVEITSEMEDGFVTLSIKDNGRGIDLNRYGRKLFGMYKTFHGNADARGIGLFMTKNQVEAMGGKIEVKSKIDQGTTFTVYLLKAN